MNSSNILRRNHVQVIGETGPVLMFAHGFGCNQNMWARIVPAFSQRYRLVLFDYVGCGKSDYQAFEVERYSSLRGYAQDVLEICDALNLQENVIFVGHSVSCSIGMLAAIARPQLFQKLLLVGPSPCFMNKPPDYNGGFERQDLEELLTLMDQNYLGWTSYLTPIVAGENNAAHVSSDLFDSFCSTDPSVMRVFARATFFADNRDDLPKVKTPCLILQHRSDALAPLQVGEYLHQHLANSQLKILEVSGHCGHMSHPDLVISALEEYLVANK